MSLEGCQEQTQVPLVSASTVFIKKLWPQAYCVKVTGESATSKCSRDTAGHAQHPEVGTTPGTSAPLLISIIVDKGLRLGLC